MERFVWFLHKIVSRFQGNKVVIGVLVAACSIWAAAFAVTPMVSAADNRDCDANAIMKCGALTAKEFATKYKENASKDLDNIYAAYGLSKSEAADFAAHAKLGRVTRDGEVILNGKVVATGAQSLGRENKEGSHTKVINGETYFERPTRVGFADGTNSISAWILMKDNKPQTVIITSCGNPVKFSTQTCDMLHKEAVEGQKNTYRFYTTVKPASRKVKKVVYTFGDGTTVTKNDASTKVTHTYKKAGKFTAKVTVHFETASTSATATASCTSPIEVKATITKTSTEKPKPETPAKEEETEEPADEEEKNEAPAALPETGLAMAGSALGLSSVAGAGYYWLNSRRDLVRKLLRRN